MLLKLLKPPEIRSRDVWKLEASGLVFKSNEHEIVRCFGVSAAKKVYYVIPLLFFFLSAGEVSYIVGTYDFWESFFFVAIHLKINLTLSFVIHVYMLTPKTCM